MRRVSLGSAAHKPSLRKPLAGQLAWACAAASALLSIVAFGIAVSGAVTSGDYRTILSHQALTPFLAIGFTCIGALVASRHPRNPVGWIFVAVGLLFALTALAAALAEYGPASAPVSRWALWFGAWLWIPAVFLPGVFVRLVFPDGHLPSPRWRLVAWPAALGLVLGVLVVMLYPALSSPRLPANPLGLPGAVSIRDGLLNLGVMFLAIGYVGSWGALFVRFRRSAGIQREQIKWLVYAMGVDLLLSILGWSAGGIWPEAAWTTEIAIAASDLGILAIAVAAAIAILRYRLYDIDLVINRTLVYGALTAAVAVFYLLVVGGLGVLLEGRGSMALSLLGVGMVAIVVQPLRDRLQRAVNRLMYGERDNPYAVLSRLGQQMEATLTSDQVLPAVVETVARTLKLPYAAISLREGASDHVAASFGLPLTPSSGQQVFPLHYQSDLIGHLLVAPRAPAEPFTSAEHRLLEDIARQVEVAVHNVRLTADLQHSRERLVTAREEERRRIRRDLHDGLGPVLASQSYRLDAVLDLMDQDPATARKLVREVKAQTQATLAEIRRLVYELRPPALDELGLAAALQAQFAQSAHGLRIQIQALPENLPPLSAAVEVAAFRIAAEAVTNAARHAGARECRVRLVVAGGELQVEISDDGRGLPVSLRPGVGLASMRERAAELGGTCAVEGGPHGGTRVVARLPFPCPPPAP